MNKCEKEKKTRNGTAKKLLFKIEMKVYKTITNSYF